MDDLQELARKNAKTARDELARIERDTDWDSLTKKAMGPKPQADPLYWAFEMWKRQFRFAERGEPLEPDFPEPVRTFFQRIMLADYPPPVWDWLIRFKMRKGRPARMSEIPKSLRDLIPKSKRGRPRLDTVKYREARLAWQVAVMRKNYEMRRDMIRFFRGKPGVSSCFGLDQVTMLSDSPSNLALELISSETGYSTRRLDQMRIRGSKK